MTATRLILQIVSAAALAGGPALSDCSDANETYKRAVDSVSVSVQRYAQCVAGSYATDDCSARFRQVRSAQSDFETAVSEDQSECR